MSYDWLRSGQILSPVAASREQGISAEGVPASSVADIQAVDDSAASHSHIEVPMMHVASGQGISANEGMVPLKGTLTNEEDTAAKEEDTVAKEHAPEGKHLKAPLETRHHPNPVRQKQSWQLYYRQSHIRQTQRKQA